MSGGSFGYLCYVEDLHELVSKRGYLEDMRIALSSTGFADKEASDTQEIIDKLEELDKMVQVQIQSLREVWRAVEWWYSSDSGQDEVRKAVEERKVQAENFPGRKNA